LLAKVVRVMAQTGVIHVTIEVVGKGGRKGDMFETSINQKMAGMHCPPQRD